MDETLSFDRQVKYVISVIIRTLLRRLDGVSQLLHEIGHLLNEAGQLLVADSHHGVWQAGRPSVGSIMIVHPITSFNTV